MPRLFLCWVAALISASWAGIVAVELGRFSAWLPLVAGALGAGAAAFALRSFRIVVSQPAAIAPALALALLPTILPPIDTTLLSQDASIHRASGIWLARTGSLAVEDEVLPSLGEADRVALFDIASVTSVRVSLARLPGGLVLPDVDEATSFPSFSHLLAVWVAIAWQLAGEAGVAALAPLFAFTAWWAIGLIALIDAGWIAALVAPALIASWLPEHWFARFLMPEILAQALVWSGVAAARLSADRGSGPDAPRGFGRPAAVVAGVALGVAAFARLEQFGIFLPSLLLARALVPAHRRVLPRGALLPFVLVVAHAGLHLFLVPTDYGNRAVKLAMTVWWHVVLGIAALSGNDGYVLVFVMHYVVLPGMLLAAVLWLVWTWRRNRRSPGFAIRANAAVLAAIWLALLYSRGLPDDFPALRSLLWYVPWPIWGAVAAGLGGIRLLPPLDLALSIEAVDQIVSGRVSVEQIWASRRLVTVVLPLIALAAARGASGRAALVPGWVTQAARGMVAVGLLLGILSLAPAAGRTLQGGGSDLASRIAAALPEDAVVLVAEKLDWTHLAAALWLEHGRKSLVWRRNPGFEEALARYLAASPQRPFLLAGGVVGAADELASEELRPPPPAGYGLREAGRFAAGSVMLEAPTDRAPRDRIARRTETVLYELVPDP